MRLTNILTGFRERAPRSRCASGDHTPCYRVAHLAPGPDGEPLYWARDCTHCGKEKWPIGSPDEQIFLSGRVLATADSTDSSRSYPGRSEATVLKGAGTRALQRQGWLLVDSLVDYRFAILRMKSNSKARPHIIPAIGH